jgi:predicted acylesterase/phospholipase RssA
MNNDQLTVYALPASGSAFVAEIALLCEVYAAKKMMKGGLFSGSKDYAPDLVLGSSGGNMSAYIGLAADWSEEGLIRVVKKLRDEMFVKSWLPKDLAFIPSWLLIPFNGSVFRQGIGAGKMFNSLFTKDTIKRVEIWTGVYDETNKKTQFFCNLSKDEAMISSNVESELYGLMPSIYLDGNLDLIAKASVASASIPGLVRKQYFLGNYYSDGACTYSSPLTAMCTEIIKVVKGVEYYNLNQSSHLFEDQKGDIYNIKNKNDDSIVERKLYEIDLDNWDKFKFLCNVTPLTTQIKINENNNKRLRLFYFFPYKDKQVFKLNRKETEKTSMTEILEQIYHSNMIQDRNNAVDMLKHLCACNDIKYSNFDNMTTKKLSQVLTELEQYKHFVLILCPKNYVKTSIIKINEKDMIDKINSVRREYSVEAWYA